jgi:putative ABC transport system permease protein
VSTVPYRLLVFLMAFFREAVHALWRHRLRSGLTTLGITIGIAAVILIVAIGKAGSERALSELQKLGDNLVWVEAGSRNVAGVRTGSRGTTSLTIVDADAIRREVPLIRSVSPQVDGNVQLVFENKNWATRFRAGSPEYMAIRRWELAEGANFTEQDVTEGAAKVLIGQTVRAQLFGTVNPVGKIVRVRSQLFEVIGLLSPKGQSGDGRDQDDWILLPHTTAQQRLRGGGIAWLDDIFCSAVSPQAVQTAIDQVSVLLRERHAIGPGQDDDFNIRRPDEVLKAQLQASEALQFLLIGIGSVSLLVGGIGIMNVMLASVAQRTREIGVRMAVGAKEWTIGMQFICEAVVLSFLGGVFGVGLSVAGAFVFEQTLKWPVAIPASTLVLAIATAAAVGIFFGFYPAWRASRLDPITALRHEV